MAKTTLSGTEQVAEFMITLDHSLKDVVQELREVILNTDPEIAEQVKWNSPAFYYTGEMASFDLKEYKRDLIVLHLRKKDQILLVFPTGANINNTTELLEGDYTDGRRMLTLKSMDDLKTKKESLQQVIRQWLTLIEK
jgi:uncharacterized protein YdhG (YjbR/CyaY superfamily)